MALGGLSDTVNGDCKAVEDVVGHLTIGPDKTIPAGLRPYGALALLAVTVNIPKALWHASGTSPSTSASAVAPRPPEAISINVPSIAASAAITALAASPAMEWAACDTGGIAFADVVAGHIDGALAFDRWLLAFFASRHRRLLEPQVIGGVFCPVP